MVGKSGRARQAHQEVPTSQVPVRWTLLCRAPRSVGGRGRFVLGDVGLLGNVGSVQPTIVSCLVACLQQDAPISLSPHETDSLGDVSIDRLPFLTIEQAGDNGCSCRSSLLFLVELRDRFDGIRMQ